MEKPNLKTKNAYKPNKPSFWKRSGKKILLTTLGLGMTLLTAFTFVGCANNNNNNQNPPEKDPPSVVVDPETSISLAEFVKSYKDEANKFIVDVVESKIVDKNKVLNKKFYISANENAELNHLDLVYTLSHDDTKRSVEIANVDLVKPVDLDDIVDGTAFLKPVDFKFDLKNVFDFDAKENFFNKNITNALYSSAEVESPVKLYSEKLSKLDNSRSFNIYKESENNISVLEVKSNVQDLTDENLLLNLADPAQVSVDGTFSFDFKGANTLNESYSLEKFEETENPGHGPEITDPQEPEKEEITDAEVVESLNQYCADGVIKRALVGTKIDKDKVINDNWYFSTDANGNVTKAEYSFEYKRSDTSKTFIVGSVTFDSPISKEDLKNGNVGNVTYNKEYSLGYNPTIQETREALTNAILSACTDQLTEGSTRIIVDLGGDVSDSELGEAQMFKVIEITEEGIKEFTVSIKYSTNDAGFIKNLQNNQFKKRSESTYKIQGTKLEQNTEKTSNPYDIFAFDLEDLLEY